MPNITFDINSDSYQSGTTQGTCSSCRHQGDMERWTTTRSVRLLGIPMPFKSGKESLKCTACGTSEKIA